jgi:hypothetical protein
MVNVIRFTRAARGTVDTELQPQVLQVLQITICEGFQIQTPESQPRMSGSSGVPWLREVMSQAGVDLDMFEALHSRQGCEV